MLPHKITLALSVHPCQMNCALALDEPHHLRYRILRRDRQQHMDVVGHQVALLHPALLLASQLPEHLAKVYPQLTVQGPSSALRDEHHVVFALPRRVAQTLIPVHRVSSFRALGGSRWKSLRWTLPKMSNFYCLPGRAGGPPMGG